MVVTFLPYDDFFESLYYLDVKRLGKQRVEAFQILNVLTKLQQDPDYKGAWSNTPQVRMWQGYEDALRDYLNTAIECWTLRGYQNNMDYHPVPDDYELPWWFGWDHLHCSHQASLLRKDPDYYSQLYILDPWYIDKGYLWPNKVDKEHRLTTKKIDIFAPVSPPRN